MEWTEWAKEFYLMLMDPRKNIRPYTLNEIDAMDIYFYFKLLRHKGKESEQEQAAALDSMGI